MDENNFKNGNRQPTDTDVALAKAYYPMLCELAKEQKEVTFKEFVEAAKTRYPKVEEVQNAIPVSTGRRLEFVRLYTKEHGLPDLSAWVVSQAGTNSDEYMADFDPVAEREATAQVNWDEYEGDWGAYIVELTKATIKIKRRKEPEARTLMWNYFKDIRDQIPNPKKLPEVEVVKDFREAILERLMEGKSEEDAFNDVIFDMS